MSHSENSELVSRRNRFAIGVSVLLLALAVFGWGLRSKLSLYHVRVSETTPIAKLLSERERPPAPAQHCEVGHADLRAMGSRVTLLVVTVADESPRARRPREDAPPLASRVVTFKGPSLRRPPPPLPA